MNKTIGFIGAGRMGSAIIKGLIDSGFCSPQNIIASEINKKTAQKVSEDLGIKVITSNDELIHHSDIVIIAVKPFIFSDVLDSIKGKIKKDQLIISIAAGVSTKTIEDTINRKISVIRAMPNTPALVNQGMTAVCKGRYTSDIEIEFARQLFEKVGTCLEVPENLIDAVTGISGSGPAFMYLLIEALADGGVKVGLPKPVALTLAAQTAIGSAKMILETGKHPSVLKDEVTTPGGCTAAGLAMLEEKCVRSALIKTVEETAKTAKSLV